MCSIKQLVIDDPENQSSARMYNISLSYWILCCVAALHTVLGNTSLCLDSGSPTARTRLSCEKLSMVQEELRGVHTA